MTRKRLVDRLDDLVHWTGIPRLTQTPPPRHHLRWLPIVALTLGTVGMAITLSGMTRFWIGYAALMLGFALANFLPIFGPIKQWGWGAGDSADERERLVRRNAYAFAFALIAFIAFFGQFALIGLTLLAGWTRDHLLQLIGCDVIYLMLLFSSVPTLHASWATRPPPDED